MSGQQGGGPESNPAREAAALSLVHEGWSHLQLQRPLAAWASWQSALRVVPEFPAATSALNTLEQATELPATARTSLRFRQPTDPEARSRWNELFQGRDLTQLDAAEQVFEKLVDADARDASAWFNRAICAAWLGKNPEAITCLDQAVQILALSQPEDAASAWKIAEVLRQGAGAEALCDDLRYAWTLDWSREITDRLVSEGVDLRELPPVEVPAFPATSATAEMRLFEWLDRPMPEEGIDLSLDDIPRVMASVIETPRNLRLSSPRAETLEWIREELEPLVDQPLANIRREASPLPLPLVDAAIWSVRLPLNLDEAEQARLSRDLVEFFYEDLWIHMPRQGLAGLSPLEASRRIRSGDAVLGAKLAAVIKFREELAARPRAAFLYQGYPFDRLRRRLGLATEDPTTTESDDPSCMSEADLAALDPSSLKAESLAEAIRSALALREDRLVARLASPLRDSSSEISPRIASRDLFATLIREAMRVGDPEQALAWVDLALKPASDPDERRTYAIWQAEIQVRTGQPDEAVRSYLAVAGDMGMTQSQFLDAAEDLLSHGHAEHASQFLDLARECSELDGNRSLEARRLNLEAQLELGSV
ncbi:tetratricopeptide repeat protein [Singulisphaera sp. PoT]|uniref:CHAT domain-containing protein n=1 Tax=Singulisphaera sp. PoT TaxID=3411797 RepID=UPI003BF5C0D2